MGEFYLGNISVTATGKKCLPWSPAAKQMPDMRFPDKDLQSAENYCRNPDRRYEGPWCFVSSYSTAEQCNIPNCREYLWLIHPFIWACPDGRVV